ncbi:MAG: hypothetical protein JSV86_08430 [Gemmatimonadota bacterium]|nr:MAG: hypothetical protein JSV86_08430 [Gemmatimonadota bacterium]
MADDTRQRLREALIRSFRGWGGYWNVSPTPPGTSGAPPDRWLLRIHSRPITRAELAADVAEAYLNDPADPEAVARWQEEVRAVFEHAKATDELH